MTSGGYSARAALDGLLGGSGQVFYGGACL